MKNVIYRQQERENLLSELGGDILSNARNELYMKMRFLGTGLFHFKFAADDGMIPAGTDGEILFFNKESIPQLFREDRRRVNRLYMHILIHCLFCHLFVRPQEDLTERGASNRDKDMSVWLQGEAEDLSVAGDSSDIDEREAAALAVRREKNARWSLACDITVEYIIDGLYEPAVHQRKSAQRLLVYERLEKDLRVVTAQGVYRWLLGELPFGEDELVREFRVDDHRLWEDISPQRRSRMQNQWEDIRKRMQTEMETFAKEASQDSRTLYDQLKVENRRRYDYRAFLRKFSVLREETEIDPDSFDYIFYHYGLQMYGNMPLIEPQETRETMRIEEFVIVIDTSMSCKPQLVQRFLEETYSILTQQETYARRFHIRLIQCDERVQRDMLITCREELREYIENFTVEGRGGTDFRPAFAYVSGLVKAGVFRHLKGLLYFTDGYGIFPVKKPVYDTAFIFMKDDYSDVDVPPWAIKIILDPLEWEGSIK